MSERQSVEEVRAAVEALAKQNPDIPLDHAGEEDGYRGGWFDALHAVLRLIDGERSGR